MSVFTTAVQDWGALVIGAIGILLAAIGFVSARKTQARARRIASDLLLSQAWDRLGHGSATTWIFGEPRDAVRMEEARRKIGQALLEDPDNPKAYMYYGVYWHFMGEYEKALAQFHQAIKRDVAYSSAYNNLGKTYEKLNDLEAATENYRLALRHDESFTYARFNLGRALLIMGNEHEAMGQLEQVTGQRHCPSQAHQLLGQAYMTGGLHSKAKAEFETARVRRLEEQKARAESSSP